MHTRQGKIKREERTKARSQAIEQEKEEGASEREREIGSVDECSQEDREKCRRQRKKIRKRSENTNTMITKAIET